MEEKFELDEIGLSVGVRLLDMTGARQQPVYIFDRRSSGSSNRSSKSLAHRVASGLEV